MSDTEVSVGEGVGKKTAKDLVEVAAVENKVNGEPENKDKNVNSNGDADENTKSAKRKRDEENENEESSIDVDPEVVTEKRVKLDTGSTNNSEKETNGDSDSAISEENPTVNETTVDKGDDIKVDSKGSDLEEHEEEITTKTDSDQSKQDSVTVEKDSNSESNEKEISNSASDVKEDSKSAGSVDGDSKSDSEVKSDSDKGGKEDISTDISVKEESKKEEKLSEISDKLEDAVKNSESKSEEEESSMEIDQNDDETCVKEENNVVKADEILEGDAEEKFEGAAEKKLEGDAAKKLEGDAEKKLEVDAEETDTGNSVTEQKTNTTSVIKTVVKGTNGEETLNDNKSVDSDKENVESPMDLSKPGGKAEPSPDVIMLSDEDEEPKMNGFIDFKELTPAQQLEQSRIIRKLQEELRNEEAKLVLLKKLRQSQVMQHFQEGGQPSQAPPTNKVPPSRSANTAPPPLVRGGGQILINNKDSRNMPPQLVRHPSQQSHQRSHSGNQGPPPLVMAPSRSNMSNMSSGRSLHSNQQGIASNPPNLIQGYSRQPQQPPPQPEQTPAQRQAAAKLALRKQLEKTLLQIPPPKPPPPEMNFIPSLAGNEFICLVGLEEVVKHITESDAKSKGEKTTEVKYVFNPFVCVQCGTDFTPVWKRDKPGSKNVICEQCVTSNQKKALKQEHTNRLKSAFVKALQQEQEIEQRMQSQAATTSSSSSSSNAATTTSTTTATTTSHHSGSHSLPMSGLANFSNASYTSPMNLSTGFKPSQDQIRQHQNLIQAHQAQLRAAVPLGFQFNPRLAFPYQAAPISNKAAADLQRQYLLDMINPGRTNQNPLHWKS